MVILRCVELHWFFFLYLLFPTTCIIYIAIQKMSSWWLSKCYCMISFYKSFAIYTHKWIGTCHSITSLSLYYLYSYSYYYSSTVRSLYSQRETAFPHSSCVKRNNYCSFSLPAFLKWFRMQTLQYKNRNT